MSQYDDNRPTLKVGSIVESPFFYECAVGLGSRNCKSGLGIDLLRLAFLEHNLIPVKYSAFGKLGTENNSVMNGIVIGESDISLPILRRSPKRSEVLTIIEPAFIGTKYAYLVNPLTTSISRFLVFKPFDSKLWFFGFFLYILVIVYFVYVRYGKCTVTHFTNSLFDVSFRQKKHNLWKSSQQKMIITIWSLFAKLLLLYYRRYFVLATVAISKGLLASYFNNIDKVVLKLSNGGYKLILPLNSLAQQNFITLGPMTREHLDMTPYVDKSRPSIAELASYTMHNRGTIMVLGAAVLSALKDEKNVPQHGGLPSFVVTGESSLTKPYYAVAQNHFNASTLEMIKVKITLLRQFGLVEKLSRKYDSDDKAINAHLSWLISSEPPEPVDIQLMMKFWWYLQLEYRLDF